MSLKTFFFGDPDAAQLARDIEQNIKRITQSRPVRDDQAERTAWFNDLATDVTPVKHASIQPVNYWCRLAYSDPLNEPVTIGIDKQAGWENKDMLNKAFCFLESYRDAYRRQKNTIQHLRDNLKEVEDNYNAYHRRIEQLEFEKRELEQQIHDRDKTIKTMMNIAN
ncbi:hypothetical protein AB4304_13950 [Vibrio breoganii]